MYTEEIVPKLRSTFYCASTRHFLCQLMLSANAVLENLPKLRIKFL